MTTTTTMMMMMMTTGDSPCPRPFMRVRPRFVLFGRLELFIIIIIIIIVVAVIVVIFFTIIISETAAAFANDQSNRIINARAPLVSVEI